jgi:ABC-type sugar transport system, periplasmic component
MLTTGNVLDLTSYITKDGFLDKYSSKPPAYTDGKYYTLVAGNDNYFTPRIFYHKDIFTKYNLTVPKTLDDLIDTAKILESNGITPMSIYAKDGWAFNTYMFQTMVMAEDPQVMKDLMSGKTDFNNKVVINAINNIQKLAKAGVFQKGALTMEYGALQDLFVQKKDGNVRNVLLGDIRPFERSGG